MHFLRSRFMQFASVPRAPSPTPSHALSLRVRVSCCIYEARTSFCGSPLCAGDFLGRPRPFFLELLVAFSFFFSSFSVFLGCHAAVAGAPDSRKGRGLWLTQCEGARQAVAETEAAAAAQAAVPKKRIDVGQCAAHACSLSPSLPLSHAHTHTLTGTIGTPVWASGVASAQLRHRAWLIH